MALKILIVEDELHNREAMRELLERQGHVVSLAVNGHEGFQAVIHGAFDLIFSDIRMPEMDGIELFHSVRNWHRKTEGFQIPQFIFMTAYGQVDEAVELVRKGALHFLTKPVRKKDILPLLAEVEKVSTFRSRHDALSTNAQKISTPIYESHQMKELLRTARQIAQSMASVLIYGESGTGKEVLAREIHQNSARSGGAFTAFNSAGVPENLIESELFGYKKGAFTGAAQDHIGLIRATHRGTFFIDEMESMPLTLQTKLLRVVQDKLVTPLGTTESHLTDVRWIAASNEPWNTLVDSGRVRKDLYFRLGVVLLEVPPLREHAEDIAPLCRQFIEEFSLREEKAPLKLDADVLQYLQNYTWPGNIRELKNVIERAVVLAQGTNFTLDLLPQHITKNAFFKEIRIKVGTSLENVEQKLFEETLKLVDGDKSRAAQILGVNPRTIYRWIEKNQAE